MGHGEGQVAQALPISDDGLRIACWRALTEDG